MKKTLVSVALVGLVTAVLVSVLPPGPRPDSAKQEARVAADDVGSEDEKTTDPAVPTRTRPEHLFSTDPARALAAAAALPPGILTLRSSGAVPT